MPALDTERYALDGHGRPVAFVHLVDLDVGRSRSSGSHGGHATKIWLVFSIQSDRTELMYAQSGLKSPSSSIRVSG